MNLVTVDLIKKLRKITGASIIDCKNSLISSKGNIEDAITFLRKEGMKFFSKRENNKENGLINLSISNDNKRISIVEINSQTDFVARQNELLQFSESLLKCSLDKRTDNLNDLIECKVNNKYIKDIQLDLITKFKENISINNLKYKEINDGIIGFYLHKRNDVNNTLVVTMIKCDEVNNTKLIIANDIAIQILANDPEFIYKENISQNRIDKEKEIFFEYVKKNFLNKPYNVLQKIVNGKLEKFIKEKTITEQFFIRDEKISVLKLLENNNMKIDYFLKFKVGNTYIKKSS